MDFVYELLRAGTTIHNSDSGSEVARKFNDNFENVAQKFKEIDERIDGGSSGVQKIIIGSIEQSMTDGVVDIPIAGLQHLGVIKSSEDENKIRIDANGTAEVMSLNVNKLVQTEGEYLVFDGQNS